MAKLRIVGAGTVGYGYKVEIDGVERPDVLRCVVSWDAQDFCRADVSLAIDDLDVVAELQEAEAAEMAKRADLVFRPFGRPKPEANDA